MRDRLYKNVVWSLGGKKADGGYSTDQAMMSILMDLRDELQAIRVLLEAANAKRTRGKAEKKGGGK